MKNIETNTNEHDIENETKIKKKYLFTITRL